MAIYEWKTGRSCLFKNHIHLVFSAKYRRKVFTAAMLRRLEAVFRETCLQMQGELIEFNGEGDHVHLLVSCHPKFAVSNFVGKLKGKSSYVLRREFRLELKGKLWGKHLWSPSYCVVSVGGATLDVVKKYIEAQARPADPANARRAAALRKA
jgi:putative transposase